jgi:hypothetical protein
MLHLMAFFQLSEGLAFLDAFFIADVIVLDNPSINAFLNPCVPREAGRILSLVTA